MSRETHVDGVIQKPAASGPKPTPATPMWMELSTCAHRCSHILRIPFNRGTVGGMTSIDTDTGTRGNADAIPSMNTTASMASTVAERKRVMTQECTALANELGRPLLFGMTTALALQGIALPERCDLDENLKHVTVSSRSLRKRGRGIHCHLWKQCNAQAHVKINARVYALTPIHVWAQLAMHIPLYALVALAESIIAADPDSFDPSQFAAFVADAPRFAGKTRCTTATTYIQNNVLSPAESKGRQTLIAHNIPCPETNYTVPNAVFSDSKAAMTLDMAWVEFQVGVEYDGDQHRTDKAQWRRDQEKREYLRRQGWIIICITADDLASEQRRAEFAFNVAKALADRGAHFDFTVSANPIFEL